MKKFLYCVLPIVGGALIISYWSGNAMNSIENESNSFSLLTPLHAASPIAKEDRRNEAAQSAVFHYEIPSLNHFADLRQAALIYGVLQQVGIPQDSYFEAADFLVDLYQRLLGVELAELPLQEVYARDLQAGDALYQVNADGSYFPLGLVLNEKYYVALEDSADGTRQQTILSIPAQPSYWIKRNRENQLTEEGNQLLAGYPVAELTEENPNTTAFIQQIGDTARQLAAQHDLFASVMIAQAILESNSGQSAFAQAPNHNLFGFLGSYQGDFAELTTKKTGGFRRNFPIDLAFRSYPDDASSLGDYVELFREAILNGEHLYQPAWRSEAKTYWRAAEMLVGRYTFDAEYAHQVNGLIAQYQLSRYDRADISQPQLEELPSFPNRYHGSWRVYEIENPK